MTHPHQLPLAFEPARGEASGSAPLMDAGTHRWWSSFCWAMQTHLIGTDAFQEADTTGIFMPIVKHSYLVTKAEDIPRVFMEAFHLASTGRPGPVLIDIPKDIANTEFTSGCNHAVTGVTVSASSCNLEISRQYRSWQSNNYLVIDFKVSCTTNNASNI